MTKLMALAIVAIIPPGGGFARRRRLRLAVSHKWLGRVDISRSRAEFNAKAQRLGEAVSLSSPPRHSREIGNPDGCNQDRRLKSSIISASGSLLSLLEKAKNEGASLPMTIG